MKMPAQSTGRTYRLPKDAGKQRPRQQQGQRQRTAVDIGLLAGSWPRRPSASGPRPAGIRAFCRRPAAGSAAISHTRQRGPPVEHAGGRIAAGGQLAGRCQVIVIAGVDAIDLGPVKGHIAVGGVLLRPAGQTGGGVGIIARQMPASRHPGGQDRPGGPGRSRA